MELVSVLIPTYNRLELVCEAIASVRAQTYPHYEIIVADDGSSDGTVEALRLEDLQVLSLTHGGQARARNAALARARGQFICCLDADDLWEPTYLEKSVRALRELDVAFVFANWLALDQTGKVAPSYFEAHYQWQAFSLSALPEWRFLWPAETRAMYLDSCMSPSSAVMIRRDYLSQWNELFEIGDDWYLLLEMSVRQECKCAFTMEPLWRKRVQSDNIYDQRDQLEVSRILHANDVRKMRNLLQEKLSPQEYARLSAHVFYFAIQVVRGQRGTDLGQMIQLLVTTLQGLLHSPSQFFWRLRDLSPRLRQCFPP